MAKPFRNDNFWQDFHDRLDIKFDTIIEELENMSVLVENVLMEYKFNQNPSRAYTLLEKAQLSLDNFFDKHKRTTYKENELQELTSICRKINEDQSISFIRENRHLERINPNQEQVEDFVVVNKHISKKRSSKVKVKAAPPTTTTQKEEDEPEQRINTEASDDAYINISAKKLTFDQKMDLLSKSLQKTRQSISRIDKLYKGSFLEESTKENVESQLQIQSSKEEGEQDQESDTCDSEDLEQVAKIDELYEKVKYNYQEHKLENAYDNLAALIQVKTNQNLIQKSKDYIASIFKENEVFFTKIEDEYKEFLEMYQHVGSDDGWIIDKISKSYTLKYKNYSGSVIGLRLEATIETSLNHILTLLNEESCHPAWLPYCSRSFGVAQHHRAQKTMKEFYSFPPPLSERETWTSGYGIDRLDRNGSVLLISKSVHDKPDLCKKLGLQIPEKTKNVRFDLYYSVAEMIPISKSRCKFKIALRMDPKIRFIPQSWMNWFTRKGAGMLVEKLNKTQKKFKPEDWRKLHDGNKPFYQWLDNVIEQFYQKNGITS